MKNLFLFISAFIISFSVFSQSFSDLKEFKGNGNVLYEPSITKILNLTEDQGGLEVFVLMETKIHKGKNKYYKITFDYGPSEDPNYNIYLKNGGEEEIFIASINAEKLIIPGNGYIYSCGRSNELYNKKRKYKLSDNSLIEVAQAFFNRSCTSRVLYRT